MYNNDAKLKDIVRYLRDGCYENSDKFQVGHPLRDIGVDFHNLWGGDFSKFLGKNMFGFVIGIRARLYY